MYHQHLAEQAFYFYRINVTPRHFIVFSVALLIAGCAAERIAPDQDQLVAHYFVFDFSAATWTKAKAQCQSRGRDIVHAGTVCGFFICTSTFNCLSPKK